MKSKFVKAATAFIIAVICLTLFMPAVYAKSTVKPSRPENINAVAQSYSAVKTCWDKVENAVGYEIYRASSLKGSYKRIAVTTGTTYTNKSLSASKTYYYKVRAYVKSGSKKIYSNYSTKVKVTTPKNLLEYYKSIQGSSLSKAKQKKLDTKVKSIIKDIIKDGMTDLDKANAIYNYILDNVEYEPRGWQINYANHAYGALVNGRAQCSGYSRAMTLLCAKAGIECLYVKHVNPAESGHKWNMININGQYYHLEVQGNDNDHDNPSPWTDMDIVHDISYHLLGDSNMDKEIYKWDRKKYPKCPKPYREPEPPVEG